MLDHDHFLVVMMPIVTMMMTTLLDHNLVRVGGSRHWHDQPDRRHCGQSQNNLAHTVLLEGFFLTAGERRCAIAVPGTADLFAEQPFSLPMPYEASGVGLAAGGSIWKVAAVMQVVVNVPVVATAATRLSRPKVFSAAA